MTIKEQLPVQAMLDGKMWKLEESVNKKSQEITEHEIKRLYDMLEPFKTRRQKMKLEVEELEFEIDREIAKDEIYK